MDTTRPDILTYSCAFHPLCRGSCALSLGPLTSERELPRSHASLCPTADQSSRHSGGSQMSLPGEGVQSVLASVLHARSSQLTFLSETVYVFAGLLPLLHKKRRLQEHRTSSVLFRATSPVSRAVLGSQTTESYVDGVIPGESDLGSKDESDWLTNWVICSV